MAGRSDPTTKTGPFGKEIDELGRKAGSWPEGVMVYALEIIGEGENPGVLLTGSAATWMPRAERWKFNPKESRKAVVTLAVYRAALPKKAEAPC